MRDYQQLIPTSVAESHAAKLPYMTPPGSISLHLGYPDPTTFPVGDLRNCIDSVLENDRDALQYCEEKGDSAPRMALSKLGGAGKRGSSATNFVITQGTTDALEIVPQLLLSRGEAILMEAPTYLWAIRSFRFREARLVGIPIDCDGIRTDLLTESITRLAEAGTRPKLLYVMPDFQNPTGVCMSIQRREEILRIARQFEMVILEDSPYRDLRYDGQTLPSLVDLDENDLVVSARSFSKTIGPGIRLGWITGPAALVAQLTRMKQTGACTLLSRAVASYIQKAEYTDSINRACEIYRRKQEAACRALVEHCPAEVQWEVPLGGFYIWLRLPPEINVSEVYSLAVQRGVLFLDGQYFFCDGLRFNAIRLSFSFESVERVYEGTGLLARLLKSAYQQR